WLAPNVRHRIRMLGKVQLRSVFVSPDYSPRLPRRSCLLPATSLFREVLIAVASTGASGSNTRRTRLLMDLLLEEVHEDAAVPVDLPVPRDPRLARICTHIQEHLDDMKTLREWAEELGYDQRTLHRLFIQEQI